VLMLVFVVATHIGLTSFLILVVIISLRAFAVNGSSVSISI